jgi:hypothetical protein
MPDDSLIPGVSPTVREEIINIAQSMQNLTGTAADDRALVNYEKRLEDIADACSIAKDDVIAFANSVEQARKKVIGARDVLIEYRKVLDAVGKTTNTAGVYQKNLESQISNSMLGWRDFSSSVKKAQDTIAKQTNIEKAQLKVLDEKIKAMQEVVQAAKKSAVEQRQQLHLEQKINKQIRTNTERMKDYGKTIGGIGGDVSKMTGFFGASSMSMANAFKSVTKYNQGMFDLKRTMTVFGTSTSDMNSALKKVSDNTTFSKIQFAEFANTIAAGYPQVTPTMGAIAKFAETLQNQFGPNVENAISVAKELLGVFDDFPPAVDAMMKVGDLLDKVNKSKEGGGEGDPKAIADLEKQRELLSLIADSKGASLDQQNKLAQYSTVVTDAQKESLSLNKEAAKVEQKSADAILKLGEALSPTLETIASGLQKVMGFAEMLPSALLLGVGAFQAMSAVMGSGLVGNMKMVKGATEVWFNGLTEVKDEVKEITAELENAARAAEGAATSSRGGLSDAAKGIAGGGGGGGGLPGLSGGSSNTPKQQKTEDDHNKWLGIKKAEVEIQSKAVEKRSKLKDAWASIREKKEEILEGWKERSAKKREASANRANKNQSDNVRRAGKDFKRSAAQAGTASRGGVAGKGGMFAGKGAAMMGGAMMVGSASYMAYGGSKAASKADGFSDDESHTRGLVSAGGAGLGMILGGAVGTALGGPVGTMIGATIGSAAGGGIADLINKKFLDKPKKEKVSQTKLSSGVGPDQSKPVANLAKEWIAIRQIYEMNSKLLEGQSNTINEQTDLLNSMFSISGEKAATSYKKAFGIIISQSQEAESYMEKIREAGSEKLMKLGIDTSSTKDIESFIEETSKRFQEVSSEKYQIELEMAGLTDADEIAKKQEEIRNIENERVGINNILTASYKAQADSIGAIEKISKQITKTVMGNLDPQLKLNALVESRLSSEKALMESANFGMGASVKMMQKQVDLAYNNIEAIQQTVSGQAEVTASMVSQKGVLDGIGDEHRGQAKEIIKNTFNMAKQGDTQSEIQAAIEKGANALGLSGKDRVKFSSVINEQAGKFNELQTKSLQSQKEIYDLTKDVREGYLDAVREMSFGAGEFEKIIGKQDMGVTQLMASVKGVTGENTLNTMALGGITDVNTAAGQARSGGFAKYGPNGLDFGQITGKAQEDMNTDIHGYEKSKQTVSDQLHGNKGAKPTAGTIGDNPEHMNTLRSEQEKDTTKAIKGLDANMPSAVTKGLRDWDQGLNAGLKKGGKGAPGQEKGTLADAKARTAAFGAGQARNATGQAPATTNLSSPTNVSHGALPATPGMTFSNKQREKAYKNLTKTANETEKEYKGAVKANKSQEEIEKLRKKASLAWRRKNYYLKKGTEIEKKERGMATTDAGGTTYHGGKAATILGVGQKPGQPGQATTQPAKTAEQKAADEAKKAKAAEAKAKEKPLQDLKKAFNNALNKANLATGGSKAGFEKEAGSIFSKIKALDKDTAKTMSQNLTAGVAKAIETGEDVDIKAELKTLQNVIGKGATKSLSSKLSEEKSKELEKAVAPQKKKEEHEFLYDKVTQPIADSLVKLSPVIGSLAKNIMNPKHAMDVVANAAYGVKQDWEPEERQRNTNIYSEEEKAARIGRAQSKMDGQGDIETKTMAALQELAGKDVGDIEYGDLSQFSKEMTSFFKKEKVGPKETKRILESINLGGSHNAKATQSKFLSKMRRESGGGGTKTYTGGSTYTDEEQEAWVKKKKAEIKARKAAEAEAKKAEGGKTAPASTKTYTGGSTYTDEEQEAWAKKKKAEMKAKGGKTKPKDKFDMINEMFGGIAERSGIDLKALTDKARYKEEDHAKVKADMIRNKTVGTTSLEDTKAGVKSGKLTAAQGVLGMDTKGLLDMVRGKIKSTGGETSDKMSFKQKNSIKNFERDEKYRAEVQEEQEWLKPMTDPTGALEKSKAQKVQKDKEKADFAKSNQGFNAKIKAEEDARIKKYGIKTEAEKTEAEKQKIKDSGAGLSGTGVHATATKAEKAGKGKGAKVAGQSLAISAENANKASAQQQADFASQETQAARELLGMDSEGGGAGSSSGGSGKGGETVVVIKLEGAIEGQIASLNDLKVQLENTA